MWGKNKTKSKIDAISLINSMRCNNLVPFEHAKLCALNTCDLMINTCIRKETWVNFVKSTYRNSKTLHWSIIPDPNITTEEWIKVKNDIKNLKK